MFSWITSSRSSSGVKPQETEFINEFQTKYNLAKRTNEAQRMLNKYPDRIPVIVDSGTVDTPKLNRHKFLVPLDVTVAQFLIVLRNHFVSKPDASQALFLFVKSNEDQNILLSPTNMIKEIYKTHKGTDDFLSFIVCAETTYG